MQLQTIATSPFCDRLQTAQGPSTTNGKTIRIRVQVQHVVHDVNSIKIFDEPCQSPLSSALHQSTWATVYLPVSTPLLCLANLIMCSAQLRRLLRSHPARGLTHENPKVKAQSQKESRHGHHRLEKMSHSQKAIRVNMHTPVKGQKASSNKPSAHVDLHQIVLLLRLRKWLCWRLRRLNLRRPKVGTKDKPPHRGSEGKGRDRTRLA